MTHADLIVSSAVAPDGEESAKAQPPTLAVAAGRNLIAAGAIFGLAQLFQYGVVSGALGLHPAVLSLSWPLAVTLFLTLMFRLRRSGGEAARRAGAWSRAAILSQVAAAGGLATIASVTGRWEVMAWMSGAGMALYGAAWTLAAVRGRRPWMGMIALGAFGCAVLLAAQAGSPDRYLTHSLGLFAFALLPGLFLASGRIR